MIKRLGNTKGEKTIEFVNSGDKMKNPISELRNSSSNEELLVTANQY